LLQKLIIEPKTLTTILKTMKNINWVPTSGVVGALIISGLIALICMLNAAFASKYDEVIIDVYTPDRKLESEMDMLQIFPEMATIKRKIKQVQQLRIRQQDFFTHPAPIHTQKKTETIAHYQEEIHNRGGEISIMLDNFSTKMKLFTQKTE
jgi:hypothetical protein